MALKIKAKDFSHRLNAEVKNERKKEEKEIHREDAKKKQKSFSHSPDWKAPQPVPSSTFGRGGQEERKEKIMGHGFSQINTDKKIKN